MENRGLVVMTTVGAALAATYWGVLGALLAAGNLYGVKADALQSILPFVLVVLYAMRGYKVYMGDVRSARNLMWLHCIGAIAAGLQLGTGNLPSAVVALYGAKIAIHVIGGIPALLLYQRSNY